MEDAGDLTEADQRLDFLLVRKGNHNVSKRSKVFRHHLFFLIVNHNEALALSRLIIRVYII